MLAFNAALTLNDDVPLQRGQLLLLRFADWQVGLSSIDVKSERDATLVQLTEEQAAHLTKMHAAWPSPNSLAPPTKTEGTAASEKTDMSSVKQLQQQQQQLPEPLLEAGMVRRACACMHACMHACQACIHPYILALALALTPPSSHV